MSVPEAVGAVAAFVAVGALTLRRPALGYLLALVIVGAASSVFGDFDQLFRVVRWGAEAGLVGAALVLERLQPLPLSRAFALLAGPVVVALASVAWSIDPLLTVERAGVFSALLLAVALLARRIDGGELAWGFLAVSACLSVSALLMWAADPGTALLAGQLRGPLQNPNTLGLALGLLMPVAVTARVPGVAVASVVALSAATIGVTASRTASLAAFVGLLVFAVCTRRRVFAAAAVGVVAVAIAVGAYAPGGSSGGSGGSAGVWSYVGADGTAGGNRSRLSTFLGARDEAWKAAARTIEQRPVLGFGFGTGEDRLFARLGYERTFVFFQGEGPANAYLQIAMTLGIVGIVLFLVPLGGAAVGAARAAASPWVPALFAASVAAAIFESTLTSAGAPWAYLAWLPVAALLGALGRRRSPRPPGTASAPRADGHEPAEAQPEQ